MAKWPRYTAQFRVKVSYRKSKTRGTIAIPAPILAAWGYPEYLQFEGDNGSAIIKPVKSDVRSSTPDSCSADIATKALESHLTSDMTKSDVKPVSRALVRI